MALLSGTQLGYLRADGHRSKFYLSVVRPAALLTASVNNGAIARGATAIAFDGGTSADTSRIKAGTTLVVTTATGTEKVRVSAFTSSGSSPNISGTITADTNHIAWGNNQALTIYEMFEPWVIMPTFNANTGVSTKRGQTFANQTRQPGPLANAGPHRTGFVEGGSLAFSLSAAGVAMTPGATISSYAWSTTIGTLSNAAIANPTLTIVTPGEGWIFFTVTDSNGKTHTGARHVWAHSTDPENSNYPYTDFEVSGLSLTANGCRASFKVTGLADFTQFADGALVVLWKESWYGATKTQISLATGAEGQLFVGYIVKDSILADPEHGSVTFEAQSLADISRLLSMQALSIHAEATVSYWFQMPTWMTLRHMLHWLLHWHSNLLELADWNITTNTKKKKLFTFNDGNIGSQALDAASKLPALIGGNKAGQMFVEENVQFLDTAARAAVDEVFDITEADWREQMTIVRRPYPAVAAVDLKGYAFDGTTITPYCAAAPTRIRANRGSKTSVDGMIVSSQADANMLAGRYFAAGNNPIEELRVAFAGDYSVLDIFPQKWYTTTLASGDTLRGLALTDIRLVPRTINLQLNPKDGVCLVDAVFEAEAFGPDGIAVTCPSSGEPPSEVSPAWAQTPGGAGSTLTALVAGQSVDFRDSNAADWTQWDEQAIAHATVDRFWKAKAGSTAPDAAIVWTAATGAIRRVTKTETSDRTPAEDPPDSWSDPAPPTVETLQFIQVWSDPFAQSRLYALANWNNDSGWKRAWLLRSEDEGSTWEYLNLWDGTIPDKLHAVWMAGNGTRLLVTTWEERTSVGKYRLHVVDISDGSFVSNTEIAECSESELSDNTYVAFPVTVMDDNNLWYVAGRFVDPFALTGTYHVIKSANAGSTWANVENGWAGDYCGALVVGPLSGGNRTHYAIRNAGSVTFTPATLLTGSVPAVAKMSATRALVYYIHPDVANPFDVGTLALLDISTNPPTVLDSASMPGGNLRRTYPSISRIDDNFALLGCRAVDTGSSIAAASVNIVEITGALDDTLTIGTSATVATIDAEYISVAALSATKGVITYFNDTNNRGDGAVLDLDTATRTITPNTVQTWETPFGMLVSCCCKVDSTSALVLYLANDFTLQARVLDAITGSSWTLGSAQRVDTEGTHTAVFNAGGSPNGQHVAYLTDGEVIVVYDAEINFGDYWIVRAKKLTVSGTGISNGGANQISFGGIGTRHENPTVGVSSPTQAYCLYRDYTSGALRRANISDNGLWQSTTLIVSSGETTHSVGGNVMAWGEFPDTGLKVQVF